MLQILSYSTLLIVLFFTVPVVHADIADSISSEVDSFELKMQLYTNSNNTVYLNAIKNVIRKNAHDAAGAIATIKLVGFDNSYDLKMILTSS